VHSAVNPWCQLSERLVRVADADTACQEILRVFYRLQDDESWTAEVSISITYIDSATSFGSGRVSSLQHSAMWHVSIFTDSIVICPERTSLVLHN